MITSFIWTFSSLILLFTSPSYFEEPRLVISYTKTQCFGQCPAFEFQLYSDCTTTYNGIANVERLGEWNSKLSPEEYAMIVSEFEDADFFSFQDRYYKEITDLPSTYVFYDNGEQDKKILDYYGAPEKLKSLESSLDELIEKLEWSKSSPKP